MSSEWLNKVEQMSKDKYQHTYDSMLVSRCRLKDDE